MSGLADLLREMILQDGPMPLERFMALALNHPEHGYYTAADPFGAAGDFTTAPEISQMFGELVGLWATEAWRAVGAPSPVRLLELGPGRGTMMADAVRACRLVPEFVAAADIHLVEASPVLRERQGEALANAPCSVTWHRSLDSVPDGPAIVLANEFFDALPLRHYLRTPEGWRERLVGLGEDGAFAWKVSPQIEDALQTPAPLGAVLEIGVVAARVMRALAERLVKAGGALLAIDYGHTETALGDTLQAVRRHRFVDPLDMPGAADLTAHVDFAALARAAQDVGAVVHGPVTQAAFLEDLGIRQRAAVLTKSATPAGAQSIATALNRLTADESATDMGRLFKVLAVTAPGSLPVPGFATTRDET